MAPNDSSATPDGNDKQGERAATDGLVTKVFGKMTSTSQVQVVTTEGKLRVYAAKREERQWPR